MSSVEYVAILASILLGLAVADLATSFHRLIRGGAKVRWHWLPVVFAAIVLVTIVQFWWATYERWMTTETIGQFLVPMMQLLLLFLLASAALPDHIPDDGLLLREYYFDVHRYAWGLFAAYVASAIAIHATRGNFSYINLAAFLVACSLAVWRNRWLHYVGIALLSLPTLNFLRLQIAA